MTAEYLHVVDPGEGEAIWFLQTLMVVKASGAESGGAFSLIEAHYPPAFSPPLHVHHNEDESFYVLEGEVAFTCGDRTWTARKGAFAVLPRGVQHGFTIGASAPAKMLQMSSAPGLERFFRDAGLPATERALPCDGAGPDLAGLRAAAERYGVELTSAPVTDRSDTDRPL
jgi:quercetin dioxygenase-like cupin family protein